MPGLPGCHIRSSPECLFLSMYIKLTCPIAVHICARTRDRHAMLHFMHPQDTVKTNTAPRSGSQRAVSAGTAPRKTDAIASANESPAAPVTMEEHMELFSEYKKQDKFIHELSIQNEVNKERASKYKQSLKARIEDVKALQTKMDKYKAQVKSLESERAPGKGSKDVAGKALTECKSRLAATAKELADVKKELAGLQREVPEVKDLLTMGGQAIQKLEAATKRNQELQQQVADLKAKSARTPGTAGGADQALQAKNQQLQSEVVAVKDKLKAASQEVSARVSQVAACRDMLAKSEQVLRTCSDLHASKGDALASALKETTANVQSFLDNLDRYNSSSNAK